MSLNLAPPVPKVNRAKKATPARKALLAPKVNRANKVTPAHKALLARKVNRALPVSPVGIPMAMANPTKMRI